MAPVWNDSKHILWLAVCTALGQKTRVVQRWSPKFVQGQTAVLDLTRYNKREGQYGRGLEKRNLANRWGSKEGSLLVVFCKQGCRCGAVFVGS